jgi:hypothetical protein
MARPSFPTELRFSILSEPGDELNDNKAQEKERLRRILLDAAETATRLAGICYMETIEQAESFLASGIDPNDPECEDWDPAINEMRRKFCRTFATPTELSSCGSVGARLREQIETKLQTFNNQRPDWFKIRFGEFPCFLSICYDASLNKFFYPSFESLMDSKWFVGPEDLCNLMMSRWSKLHPEAATH